MKAAFLPDLTQKKSNSETIDAVLTPTLYPSPQGGGGGQRPVPIICDCPARKRGEGTAEGGGRGAAASNVDKIHPIPARSKKITFRINGITASEKNFTRSFVHIPRPSRIISSPFWRDLVRTGYQAEWR
jgi:hypothetical protein